MATQVQFRRGTTTQNNAFTGAVAEMTYDTDIKTMRIHDGSTPGGGSTLVTLNATQNLTNKTLSTGSQWTGSNIGLEFGGTGSTLVASAGSVAYSTSSGLALSDAGLSGQVLTSGGSSAPTWVSAASLTAGTANTAITSTNLAGGNPGYLPYQAEPGVTNFIPPGASGTFLRSTGTSTPPNWAAGQVTVGSTSIDLGATQTDIAGLTSINAVSGATSFFSIPTSPTLFASGTSISIGAAAGTLTVNNAQTVFDSTDSIQIPVGTTAQRDGTPVAGQIRYNSTISSFEGYGPGNAWGSLGGVKDVDQDTYLITEASAGSDEDTFEFFNAGTNTAALDTTALELKNDVYMQFDTGSAAHPTHSEGALFYSAEYKALTYMNDISGSSLQIGHEEWVRVKNVTGSTIANGTPVYITGASGETFTVAPADATTAAKAEVLGIVTNDIADQAEGVVTTRGLISGFNTSALTAGQRVHVGPSGALQTAAPTAPYFPTDVGTCVVSDATNGYIYVTIQEHTFEQFRVTGNTKMDGNLTVTGDLNVYGTQTITSEANLALDNAFIYMNSGDTIGEANTTFTGSGLDDAYFAGHFEGTSSTSYYVKIDSVGGGTGGVDTFEWSKDNFSTTEATGVDLAASVALDNNITIKFNATTGHTLNDVWSGTGAPLNVDSGWASNRNTGASGVGYTHMGVIWDTASSQMIMFDTYDPEIEGNIDTGHASFSYAPLRIDGLTATTGAFSSNATVGGTLGVTGTTSLSNLGVTGTATIATANITSSTIGTLGVTGNTTLTGDIAVNGGDLTTNKTTFNLLGSTATTVNAFGAATDLQLGATTGTTTVRNSLVVTGNFTVNGTVTTVNSTEVSLDNLIFVLGGDTPPSVDDNLDRGVAFRYFSGSAKYGFFGWNDDTQRFSFIPNATNTNGVISGTLGDIEATNFYGALSGNASTATTLQTARTINGVSFNGSSNIVVESYIEDDNSTNATRYLTFVDNTSAAYKRLNEDANLTYNPGTNTLSTTNFAGNASTASILQSTRTIQGVGFNGSQNITVVTAGTGVGVNGTVVSIGQPVGTSDNVRFNSIGVGTTASGTAGEIRATNMISSYYSDDRLKTRGSNIENALEKVLSLDGFYYEANEVAQSLGYEAKQEVGVSAQAVQAVLPEIVVPAPIDDTYLTVQYERLVPLLIEAIKEQQKQIDELKAKLGN